MPVMDGMTSTRAIRQLEDANNIERCRIVALTGLASASARLEALSSGVDHFMTKPLNFRDLEALLQKEEKRKSLQIERRNSMATGQRMDAMPSTEVKKGGAIKETVMPIRSHTDPQQYGSQTKLQDEISAAGWRQSISILESPELPGDAPDSSPQLEADTTGSHPGDAELNANLQPGVSMSLESSGKEAELQDEAPIHQESVASIT